MLSLDLHVIVSFDILNRAQAVVQKSVSYKDLFHRFNITDYHLDNIFWKDNNESFEEKIHFNTIQDREMVIFNTFDVTYV